MNLIVVESPTKARTLGKFLGNGYQVLATMGHIRDLPEKKIGIKIGEGRFEPEYIQTSKQKERTKEISKAAKKAKVIYLATDPDREGEAIAWHVKSVLSVQCPVSRISFHEITERAVKESLHNASDIDMPLVDAQQARRVIDRLVGYKLSPLLWSKVRKGLSAGRVQSVAVRLVVEKEKEIQAFKAEEYWEIVVKIQKSNDPMIQFDLKLIKDIKNGEEAKKVSNDLKVASYKVERIEKKDFRRTPPAPFTTSVLQQTAANKFGWSPKKTMQVAQSLYEQGFITYHRTDSTNIAEDALLAAQKFISGNFGAQYALGKPRIFKTKNKVAQEAHEAIRPTDVGQISNIQNSMLNKDQEKLYELIWKRFVACQMQEVRGESVKIEVRAGEYKLEARGETISFDGFYKITKDEDDKELKLPDLAEGEKLEFVDLKSEQKFTQPPARFNEASLIKKLEEMGIGRPSTYAPILSTIQDRQYVEKFDRRLKPTALGIAANEFLTANFTKVLDYDFTANMESKLDEVANGKINWQEIVEEFWQPLSSEISTVKLTAERVKIEVEKTGETCPKCQVGEVIVRIGKFGRFLACSKFPDCDYKANYVNKIGIKCPKCEGDVILRKTRSHKNFYGCSNYPNCDFASWIRPSPKASEGLAKPKI